MVYYLQNYKNANGKNLVSDVDIDGTREETSISHSDSLFPEGLMFALNGLQQLARQAVDWAQTKLDDEDFVGIDYCALIMEDLDLFRTEAVNSLLGFCGSVFSQSSAMVDSHG